MKNTDSKDNNSRNSKRSINGFTTNTSRSATTKNSIADKILELSSALTREMYNNNSSNTVGPKRTTITDYSAADISDENIYAEGGDITVDNNIEYGPVNIPPVEVYPRSFFDTLSADKIVELPTELQYRWFQHNTTNNIDEAGRNYLVPAVKTALSFTPLGPALGISEATAAVNNYIGTNDTKYLKEGAIYAGMEAMPYAVQKLIARYGPSIMYNLNMSPEYRNLRANNYMYKRLAGRGYDLPTPYELKQISKSQAATDANIRKYMDQHNTFLRGVETDWDRAKKIKDAAFGEGAFDRDVAELRRRTGIDIYKDEEAAARYMATHIPPDTGNGRVAANLIRDDALSPIYTSNSTATAETYTKGNGYVVTVKRPTDYSSSNRKKWVKRNLFQYENGMSAASRHAKGKNPIIRTERMEAKPDDIISNYTAGKTVALNKLSKSDKSKYKKVVKELNSAVKGLRKELKSNIRGMNPAERADAELKNDMEVFKRISKILKDNNVNGASSEFDGIVRTLNQRYAHYLIFGREGEKVLADISARKVTGPVDKRYLHMGEASDGYSKAGITPLILKALSLDNDES